MKKLFIVGFILFTLVTAVYAINTVKVQSMTYGIKSTAITIGTSATALPTTALAGREAIAIYNDDASSVSVYIGASDVTTSNGFPLTSSAPAITLDLDSSVTVYGICASSADVRVLEAK